MTDARTPRAANIFDVARLAGVSHQTVSRVLNDMPNVRPATRERVEKAIAQLRYSPSPAARALVTRFHSEAASLDAESAFDRLFIAHELPEEIEEVVIEAGGGPVHLPAVIADAPGVYLAGDWVGPEGLLADASFASARAITSSNAGGRSSMRSVGFGGGSDRCAHRRASSPSRRNGTTPVSMKNKRQPSA